MLRYSVGQSKGNEVNRAFLLPVWETIGRKTDVLVRIEELQVIHRGVLAAESKQRDGALERRRSLIPSSNATRERRASSATETAVGRQLRKIRRVRRGGFG